MKKFTLLLILSISLFAFGQGRNQNPIPTVKASGFTPYLQPPGPAQAGLWIQVNTGIYWVSGNPVTVPPAPATAVRLSLAPNATNYIFLNLTLGQIQRNTTGFSTNIYPIAVATTNGTMTLTVLDVRPDVFGGGSGSGSVTGPTTGGGLEAGGGGTTLGLLSTCGNTQVLQWNTTAWVCATISGGGGSGNVSTTPAASQLITQPVVAGVGSIFDSNTFGQKRQANMYNWSATLGSPVTVGVNTITLTPCPLGVSGTTNGTLNANHWIYITSAGGDTQQPGEPVLVTYPAASGTPCVPGAASGTISFSSAYAHAAGAVIGSGTGGIKEANNDVNTVRPTGNFPQMSVIEVSDSPSNLITLKAPLFVTGSKVKVVGQTFLNFELNMAGIQLGDTISTGLTPSGGVKQAYANGDASLYDDMMVDGFWLKPSATANTNQFNVAPSGGLPITQGQAGLVTLTIPTCPVGFWPLIPNQILWLNGTASGLNASVYGITAPGPGDFVQVTGGNCTPGASNGTIIIEQATPGLTTFSAHDIGSTLSNGVNPYIEDNATNAVIQNISTNGVVLAKGFGFVVQIDNDQSATVKNISNLGGLRCDVDFCGARTFGPGPNGTNAGIMTLSEGTGDATGSCTEWFNGNDIIVRETTCQAYDNYAIYLSTKRGGANQKARISKVHRERGGLNNSLGTGLGAADAIINGYNVTYDGNGSGANSWPTFSVVGSPGGTLQTYYLSIMDVTAGTKTVPYPIGTANVTNPNANNVTVRFVAPDALAAHVIRAEIYRISGQSAQAPYAGACDGLGTDGTCLVATAQDLSTLCDIHGACTYTDSLTTPTATTPYTGADGLTTGGYFPYNSFAPGGIVLFNAASYNGDSPCVVAVSAPWLRQVVSSFNNSIPSGNCLTAGGGYNPELNSSAHNASADVQIGYLLPDRSQTTSGANWNGLKGRLNFLNDQGSHYPRDLVTWFDSNPAKTMATKGASGTGTSGTYFVINRPQWDAADVATGMEFGGAYLFNRAPTGFSWYSGVTPSTATAGLGSVALLDTNGFTLNIGNLNLGLGSCFGCSPFARSGTQATDTFTRANGAIGANYTIFQGSWNVVSNAAQPATFGGDSRTFAAYTASAFSNDQFSQVTITTLGSGLIGPAVRVASAAETAYYVYSSNSSSNLQKEVAGVGTNLVTGSAWAVGDIIRLEVSGTSLTVYRNGTAVSGMTSISDASIASGSAGLAAATNAGTSSIDNFRAGDLSWTTPSNLTMGGLTVTTLGTGCAQVTAGVFSVTGPGCGFSPQTNGVTNTTTTGINFVNSTTNSVGLAITPSNPSGTQERFEITGSSYTGTAANLSGTPALPNGTTGTTQALADNTTKLATDAFVLLNAGTGNVNTSGSPASPLLAQFFDSTHIQGFTAGSAGALLDTNGSNVPQWDANLVFNSSTSTFTVLGKIVATEFDGTGPYDLSSPIPGINPSPLASNTKLSVFTDGNFHTSNNGAAYLGGIVSEPVTPCTSGQFLTTSGSSVWSCASAGSGTVTTTGSPASGNLTKFSGSSSITNGDLSGDVTTTSTLVTTVAKVNGVTYPTVPSAVNMMPALSSIAGSGAVSYSGLADLFKTTYAAGGGSANAQTVTLAPALQNQVAGTLVRFLPTAANTTAATLQVNGLTAKNLTKCGTTALVANDLTTTAIAVATYDGTQYQLLNPQTAGCGAVTSVAETVPTGFSIGGSPITTSGTLAITYNVTATGQILNSSASNTAGWTATPVLGNAGTTVGTLGFQNATSGTITLSPPTGALGSVTVTIPAAADTLVNLAGTQTLTNKSIAASEINSGTLATARGGTNSDSSGSTGVAQVSGGTWSYSAALASGTTATTQSAGDNSAKVATTAYMDVNACVPGSFAAQTDAATVTWAIASAKCANASLTFTVHSGSRTLNLTGLVNGGSYVLWVKQDSTGGEGLTLGTGCTWKVSNGGAGAVTPSTSANAIDILAFTYDGTNCYANFNKNFS